MPPRALSRHSFTRVAIDDEGRQYLTRREPYRFVERRDNIRHVATRGDSLYTLAGRYFRPIDKNRACGLWWIIADFQPDPVHDPTIKLVDGQVLVIPSVRTVLEEVFSERRQGES